MKKGYIKRYILCGCLLFAGCQKMYTTTLLIDTYTINIRSNSIYEKVVQSGGIKNIDTIDIYLPQEAAQKKSSSLSITQKKIESGTTLETIQTENKKKIEQTTSNQKTRYEKNYTITCPQEKIPATIRSQEITQDTKIEYFTQAFRKREDKVFIASFFSADKTKTKDFITAITKTSCN